MRLTDPFYYLENFRSMLETLMRRDGDLLLPEELNFIAGFFRLPKRSGALLARLIMRKGPLFRARRLLYPEIGAVEDAVRPLIDLRWVTALPANLEGAPEPVQLVFWSETADTVFRLEVGKLCERLRLMFFGNFHQGWSEFVLSDLGILKYEKICMHGESRPFATRRHVEDFHRLHRCREMLRLGNDPAAVELAMPPRIADCDWLEELREQLRFHVGRAHERAGEFARALAIYSTCTHPGARVRAARLGGASGRRTAARETRRAKIVPAFPVFELTIDGRAEGAPVECRVRDRLMRDADEETTVHYVENGLINSLFGLLCWPAVFAPVPGAFFHSYHHGPADLPSALFVERRKREFARCLAELECGTYRRTILQRFIEKQGIASPFVSWGLIDEPILRRALECVPTSHLRAWFEWMLGDLRANRSGFPDLVQFWPRSRRYRMIEVKAPGDRLQDSQRRCLEFSLSHNVPVSVCRVRWTGAGESGGPAASCLGFRAALLHP